MGRVTRAVNRVNQRVSLSMAASLLAGSTLVSALLGFYRDKLLNSTYYYTYPQGIDAYTVAFIIPDFMFYILVSGALSVTFIPVFNARLGKGNKQSAWRLSASMMNLMALATLVASILIIVFAEPLVKYVVAPGLDESATGLAVSMMRVIAVNPFLFAIASVIASMQQAVGRFVFFALAPLIYNIGIIIGIVWFTGGLNLFGLQIFGGGIMGVALGVVLGSVLQLIVSSIGLIGMGFDYDFKIFWKNKGLRQVLRLLPARSLDQGIDYFNQIVEVNLASRMFAGAVRAYQQGLTLHMVPVTLIGVAISTAAFPSMTERLAQNRPDLFKKELQDILRVIVWLALPVSAIAFFTRGYLVHFIFKNGAAVVSGILGILVIAILFRSVYHIASRSFYAQQDTRTPLYISIFAIALNITLAIWFTMGLGAGLYGLAWAQSIVAVVEVAILFFVMSFRINNLLDSPFLAAIFRMFMSTILMSIVTYLGVRTLNLMATDVSFFATFPKFALIVLISFAAYLGLCRLFKLKEADLVVKKLERFALWEPKAKN
ncbi:MAG TPA: murein biosynthesis integral membrane protein MurJ [Candidatus Saccharimonadales bacterium]|nr:murein biosynthesis integral membrane protein MurJ [Candidatus Saccharimonadales bacterium]